MEDSKIIELLFAKNEGGIRHMDDTYGRRLFALADNIVHNDQDAVESVSDTYMKAWDTIPPKKPVHLFYGWADQSGYHSACVVMKDGAEIDLPIRNKVVDLDQVDYVLLPDGTKLPAPNTQ